MRSKASLEAKERYMCSPRVMEKVGSEVTRRAFLGMLGAAAAVAGASCGPVGSGARSPAQEEVRSVADTGLEVRDLTHTVSPEFPVFPGYPPMEISRHFTIERDTSNAYTLALIEHTGTHLDAPFHFAADGLTADLIPPERLLAPLAVLDISERAKADEDARVEPEDILAWEERHGPLPAGAFVGMYSGWEARLSDPETFVNLDSSGRPHWPGFGAEAAEFLVNERDVVGIGVDTLSLDLGASREFGAHRSVLPAGKYGLENLANLGEVSEAGARIVVGGPKHEGATGGPARVFALTGELLG